MKYFVPVITIMFSALLLAAPAAAGDLFDEAVGIHMMVIDRDHQGTNVRETPGGKVVRTLPYPSSKEDVDAIEARELKVTAQQGQWYQVILRDDSRGWMHASVLGSIACATEDGNPSMRRNPGDDRGYFRIPDGTLLQLERIEIKNGQVWAKMKFVNASGKTVSGWMYDQVLSANPYRFFDDEE